MDPNTGKHEAMFDGFVALKSLSDRFATINHSWILSRKHKLILYSEDFIFLMFLLQKVYQVGCTLNTELFCTVEGMGMTRGNERGNFLAILALVASANPAAESFWTHGGVCSDILCVSGDEVFRLVLP